MQRSAALLLLDGTHARIVELADQGLEHDEIAARLALDPTAVAPVLHVARAKLAALEALDDVTTAAGAPQPIDQRESAEEAP